MNYLFNRIWNSPTFTTWGSFLAKTLSLILVLPLILTQFQTAEIALWFLFTIIISLQFMADLGFGATFVRVIAYGMGGAVNLSSILNNKDLKVKGEPNWNLIAKIVSTMYAIINRLTLLGFILLISIGTLFVNKPILQTELYWKGWLAWFIVVLVTTITFWGRIYSNYLQGINKIALLRRWEAFCAFGSISFSFFILLYSGDFLLFVIGHQSWFLINVIVNYFLCKKSHNGIFISFKKTGIFGEIFDVVWPSAWRSGLGVIMSYGLIQASGLIYAQIGETRMIASYLLALKLINIISSFSRAPFYSKIPLLSRLYSEKKFNQEVKLAQRGMRLSHYVFIFSFIFIGLFGSKLLILIKSNTEFVNLLMWSIMGFATLGERFGAMHLQLYSTTNHIIWHTVTLVSGSIFIVLCLLLIKDIDVYAFPVSQLVANIGFYTWYCTKKSYNRFQLKFWSFEKNSSLVPISIFIIAIFVFIYF